MQGRDQFIIERYLQGEIIEWDLPLQDAEVTLELNREMMITGVLSVDYISSVSQGMGLFPYNDCIHWIRDGVLRGGALIQPVAYDSDGNVIITARGWSTMLDVPVVNGIALHGNQSIRDHVIQPFVDSVNNNVLNGTIGFFLEFQGTFGPLGSSQKGNVISSSTPPGSGSSGSPGSMVSPFFTGSLGGWGDDVGSGSSGGSSGGTGSLGGSFHGPPNAGNSGTDVKGQDNSWYILMPWEAANALDEVRYLAEASPADVVEYEEWDNGTNNIKKTLKIINPRCGTPRADLRFAEGENILETFASSTAEEDYANAVMVIGSGEGDSTVVAYKYLDITDTARRVHVIEDETIYNVTIANAIANLELAQRSQAIHVGSVIIDVDHPNAKLGDINIGDDIKIIASLPFIGTQIVWHRVVSITYRPGSSVAELGLSRSDAFNYLFQGPSNG